jgi:hypothetical protein
MRNVLAILIVGLLSMGASKCGDEEPSSGGAGAGGAGGRGGVGGAGSGGNSGTGSSGKGGDGGEPVPGTRCDMACDRGKVCEYVQVQCVRAPCPPQPTCVDDGSGGGGGADACADQGEHCGASGDDACCDGLECCIGIPVAPGEEFCGATCPKSDRNLKQAFAPIAPDEVLQSLKSLPITTWRYKDEPVGVAHLGPMAQDFKATFRLGKDERYIATVDADGVALAAIQAVNAKLERVEAEQLKLRTENAALRTELTKLRAEQAKRR